MHKFILAAVAATLVGAPILAAAPASAQQSHRTVTTIREHPGRTVVTERTVERGPHFAERDQHRSWRRGERFDSRYAQNYRQIDYRQVRGLRAPPRGYRWVRSGNDAVLVGITSGIIASVIAGSIR